MKRKKISQEERALSESLVDEIVGAVGLPKNRFTHSLCWRIAHGATNRMAALGVPFNRIIEEDGFPAGCAWAASNFCHPPKVTGSSNIPLSGPLLVPVNHPGAYDGLIVISKLIRDDVKIITTEIPFFQLLPNACKHFLFASRSDKKNRMLVLKDAVNHLNSGGALVYIGAGHREPDPAVYPGAYESIKGWLDIYDAFFKFVPELKVMPTIMSGMITKHWASHWLTKIRRTQRDRQRLSEFCQVIGQLMRPGRLLVTPNLSYGKAYTQAELRQMAGDDKLVRAVVEVTQKLLIDHCNHFYKRAAD